MDCGLPFATNPAGSRPHVWKMDYFPLSCFLEGEGVGVSSEALAQTLAERVWFIVTVSLMIQG
jgi:hypothetical protein